ncbi:hypothetical protein G6O45_31025, partial [Salmonella enterica subsp. enterica serovar Istanbul]|nr:hypothetical protein [Salmonella enterica subsp. enterica serovar Istanbul]
DQHPYVRNIVHRMPQGATIDFYEKDGRIVPRGFLTSAMLALLESSFPDLVLEMLHVTVPRRPRPVPGNVTDMTDDNGATLPPPRQLPDALK